MDEKNEVSMSEYVEMKMNVAKKIVTVASVTGQGEIGRETADELTNRRVEADICFTGFFVYT